MFRITYRTVVENDSFVTELDALQQHYPRIYDVKDAITWELSKRPNAGETIEGNYKIFNTYPIGPTPTFTVLYEYDETNNPDCVYLLSIRAVNTNNGE